MPVQLNNMNAVENIMKNIEEKFTISNNQLEKIMKIMESEMNNGLAGQVQEQSSSLGMLPTYVNRLPKGTERGCYLALDLGGTNFRVLLVQFADGENSEYPKIEMKNELFMVPDDVKVGEGTAFFDHIAKCMASFCHNNGLSNTYLPVGFTFSFPLQQDSLNNAVLLHWNKGFEVSGVVGNDVVQMLHEAIERRGDLNCEVVAIVNDTVGTMMACALEEPDCNIGLIIGTGLNACYMEHVDNIAAVKSDNKVKQMCVNMELGGLGSNGVLDTFRNQYDHAVDDLTSNKSQQLFEKMVGGKYLGEIVRVVLCDLVKSAGLFGGKASKKLFVKGAFLTAYVSEIEGSCLKDKSFHTTKTVLNFLDLQPSDEDCEIVARVCHLVSLRAANLCSAAIACIGKKIKNNNPHRSGMKITVGVDGTMYKRHPKFSKHISAKVNEICRDMDFTPEFILSHDGSGKGAAIIAAAVSGTV